jgi:MerR family transcriptional regulator, light-induced transcriptional regulator
MHFALPLVGGCGYDHGMPTRSRADGMRIAIVSQLLGVPIPTIRSWERRYDFPAPPRTDGLHRRYSEAELAQLRALRDLVINGHSTKDAVALVRNAAANAASKDTFPAEAVIDAAQALDAAGLRAALDASTEQLGVEDTIRRAILPAMHEIGSRWEAGRCDVGREHLATEGIRGWLARQAFLAPSSFRPQLIVLACGPKDMHTIGLESFAVILARRGWPCRVLGAMTPTDALVSAVRTLRASGAVVTAQRNVTRPSAVEAIRAVHAVRGVRALYAGSAFIAPSARKEVPGTYLGEDLVEAARVVESTLT